MPLFEGNSNDIIQPLFLDSTGAAVTDSTNMTATIYDPHGTVVDTVALAHIGDGEYRGATVFPVTIGVRYKIVIIDPDKTFKNTIYEIGKERTT